MPTDALTEMLQAELFEVRRLGLVLGEMRLQEAVHAIVGDRRWQPEGVGLKGVSRVDAVRPNHAAPLNLQVVGTNPVEHLGSERVVLQVQQVPRAVEAKALLFERHRVSTRLRELLEDPVLDSAPLELERCAEAGESCPQDRNWGARNLGRGAHEEGPRKLS